MAWTLAADIESRFVVFKDGRQSQVRLTGSSSESDVIHVTSGRCSMAGYGEKKIGPERVEAFLP